MNNPLRMAALGRAAQRAALALLALYVVAWGGKYAGLVLYLPYMINVWLLALGSLAWLAWRALRRRPFPATPFDLPLLAFLAAYLLSSLASPIPRLGLEQFGYYLACTLIFYLLVDLARAGKSLEPWLGLMLLAGAWYLFFGLGEVTAWYRRWLEIAPPGQWIPPATLRVDATIGHPNTLAALLNLLWPLAAARLAAARSRWLKAALAVYVLAAFAVLFLTSSRGGWLAAAAALAVLILLLALDRRELVRRCWAWLRAHAWAWAGLGLAGLLLGRALGALMLRQVQHPTHPTADPRGYIWQVAVAMFRARPWLGGGPGTYPLEYLSFFSNPPFDLLPHAHNFVLNQLGENGLAGAAATLALGAVLAWAAWQAWKRSAPGGRTLLAGSLAALAGLAVHSQFDLPQWAPVVNVLTAVLMAGLAAPLLPRRPAGVPLAAGNALLTAGCLALVVLSLLSGWGYTAYQRGVEALRAGNWPSAARWLEEAIRRDPSMPVYHLQAGVAYARLGMDDAGRATDPAALRKSIALTGQGLALAGNYAPDWAGLGMAKLAAGDAKGGVEALRTAAGLAPAWAEVRLALAQALEQAGQDAEAAALYRAALEMKPALAEDPSAPDTPLWREAAASPPSALPDAEESWQALAEGDAARAEALFKAQAGGVNNASAYLGLGLAQMQQGRLEEARRSLETSTFIDGSQPRAHAVLADLYAKLGEAAKAQAESARAAELLGISAYNRPAELGTRKGQWVLIYHRE